MLFLLLAVTLDVSVIGYKEAEVILPCTHTGSNITVTLSDQDIIFMWRFKDSIIVYDFVKGKDDLSQQDNQFKGRTSLSDPRKGNLSLRLKNLTVNDSGQYTCFVLGSQSKQLVMLTIKGMLFFIQNTIDSLPFCKILANLHFLFFTQIESAV